MTAVNLGDFPYDARVPGHGVKTITEENLWDVISLLDVPGLESFFIADPSNLVTRWAIEMTSRYTYCSEFNCVAFEGSYDDQPNYWVQAVGVMRQARAEASKWRANGN